MQLALSNHKAVLEKGAGKENQYSTFKGKWNDYSPRRPLHIYTSSGHQVNMSSKPVTQTSDLYVKECPTINSLFLSFPYEYDEPLHKDSPVNVWRSLTHAFMAKSVKPVSRRNNVPLLQRKYIPIPLTDVTSRY